MEATRRLVDAVKARWPLRSKYVFRRPQACCCVVAASILGLRLPWLARPFEICRSVAELRQYDVVVLTHGFNGAYGDVEYRTIFPTRAIPMLLSGRPMLVHSPPGAYLTEFFRENALRRTSSMSHHLTQFSHALQRIDSKTIACRDRTGGQSLRCGGTVLRSEGCRTCCEHMCGEESVC